MGPLPFVVWIMGGAAMGHEMQLCLSRCRRLSDSTGMRARAAHCMHVDAAALPQGPVHVALAALTYTTWARGRFCSARGPPYLRTATHPWGTPWLAATLREQVETANDQFRAVMSALHIVRTRHPQARACFAHPEDLGVADQGTPASPWRLPEVRKWSRRAGWRRQAVHQCQFGPEPSTYPCGLLSSDPWNDPRLHRGWPHMRADGTYGGPLPAHCNCGFIHERPSDDRLPQGGSSKSSLRPHFLDWWLSKALRDGPQRTGISAQQAAEWASSDSDNLTWPQSEVNSDHDVGSDGDIDLDAQLMNKLGLRNRDSNATVLGDDLQQHDARLSDMTINTNFNDGINDIIPTNIGIDANTDLAKQVDPQAVNNSLGKQARIGARRWVAARYKTSKLGCEAGAPPPLHPGRPCRDTSA